MDVINLSEHLIAIYDHRQARLTLKTCDAPTAIKLAELARAMDGKAEIQTYPDGWVFLCVYYWRGVNDAQQDDGRQEGEEGGEQEGHVKDAHEYRSWENF